MSGPDRDDLDREEAVARVLRRRAEGVHIPSFTVVEGRLTRRTPVPLAILSAAALVVVALVVGGLIADRRARVADPQPTPPVPSTSAAATDPATASVASDRFGFVWTPERSPGDVNVRPETGQGGFALPTQEWRFSACGCAVSPDGTKIAYWAGFAQPGNIELRIVDVARPGLGTAIYRPPADKRWSGLAWSSDGNGILFSLEDWPTPGGPAGVTSGTALLVIEATGGAARTLATGGGVYVPLGWDRAAGIAAAGLSGEGGFMTGYLTVRTSGDPAPRTTAMPEQILMFSVRVSADQRFVLGVFGDQGRTLRWWRFDGLGTMVTGPRLEQSGQPTWRPLSSQIAWVDSGTLHFLDVERGVTSSSSAPALGNSTPIAFRVDGSAVAATSGSSYVLLDIASGRSETIPSPGYIAGAVRFAPPGSRGTALATPQPTPLGWPARTVAEVSANLARDENFAVALRALTSGADPDPRAVGRTPVVGTPLLVRGLRPTDAREYLVPVLVDDRVIAVMRVAVDAQDRGTLVATRGWSSGPSFPAVSAEQAKVRAASSAGVATGAELVWTLIPGTADELSPFWRVTHASGRVSYVFENGSVQAASDAGIE